MMCFYSESTDPPSVGFSQCLKRNVAGLRFTLDQNLEEMNFLDVNVTKQYDILSSSLYTKPTDRNTLNPSEGKSNCNPTHQTEKSNDDPDLEEENWLVSAESSSKCKAHLIYCTTFTH